MVGLWQVLVVDVVVIVIVFDIYYGEVMLMGECMFVVLLLYGVFVCFVVGEVLINIVVVNIGDIKCIKLLVNWMVVVGYLGEDVGFYEVVKVVGEEFCLELGLIIFVGKDFMLMKIVWNENGEDKVVIFLLLFVIFVFGVVKDICKILMFQLCIDKGVSCLLLFDLGEGKNCLGVSCLV